MVVQFIAKINTEKLSKEMKLYQNTNSKDKAARGDFHFRLVEESVSNDITGYEHNGVVPILMKKR